MKRSFIFMIAVVMALVAMTILAYAAKNELSHQDKSFLEDAAKGNMLEMQLGQLASTQSSNPDIQKMGKNLTKDHSAVNQQLGAIAQQNAATLPMELGYEQKHKVDSLAKKSGSDFDRTFLDDVLKAHKNSIDIYQKEANNGKDLALRSLASQTLPKLREHQSMAQQMQTAAKSTMPGEAGTSGMQPSGSSSGSGMGTSGMGTSRY